MEPLEGKVVKLGTKQFGEQFCFANKVPEVGCQEPHGNRILPETAAVEVKVKTSKGVRSVYFHPQCFGTINAWRKKQK